MVFSGLVRFHDDLAGLLQPIDSVRQHPNNYNNGDVDALGESIEVNGMYRPVYVQAATGFIVAGNTTWEACKNLGADQIPVVYLDIDDLAAIKILVADNRVAALARPDDAHLLSILDDLAVTDTLAGTGWNDNTVEGLRLLQQAINHTPLGWTPKSEPLPVHTCPACGFEFTE